MSLHAKTSLSWLGTTRARVGFVATPDNRLMIYATGGVAYGGGSSNFSAFDAATGAFWSGSPSSTRVGWTIGGGVEYAVTNNITIKGEYLYADLGSSNFTSVGNACCGNIFPGCLRERQGRLQRIDLPCWRELQVLSPRALRSYLNLAGGKATFLRLFFRPRRRNVADYHGDVQNRLAGAAEGPSAPAAKRSCDIDPG